MNNLINSSWSQRTIQENATLTFVVQGSQILLMRKKRGFGSGKINAPGGKVEKGETFSECAIRETKEELQITPFNLKLIGENSFFFLDGYGVYVKVYLTNSFTGTPTETEEADPIWFNIDNIPYTQMWEDDILWIPHLLKQEYFKGYFLFDQTNMIQYELLHADSPVFLSKDQ